jgi:hypothetical protein
MTEAVAPPKQDHETVSFEKALFDVWEAVDKVLTKMPETSLEARRLITKELGFDPRPEELQTIMDMAGDDALMGLRRELPRSLLSLRVLAARELGVLLGENRLEVDRVKVAVALLPKIAKETERLDEKLQSTSESMAGLTAEDRDYLLNVGDVLRCPEKTIRVALLLAPGLLRFQQIAMADNPDAETYGLSDYELAMIQSTLQASTECRSQPSRICINALAMRSIMEDDLETWRETFADKLPQDEEAQQARDESLQRLQDDKIAYQFISERLQKHQDMALIAGLNGFAREMREIARSLFAINLDIDGALREAMAQDVNAGGKIEDTEPPARKPASEEDAEETPERPVSKEEIILKAIEKVEQNADQTREESRHEPGDSRGNKTRAWTMSGAAAVLLVVFALVHLALSPAPKGRIEVSAADFKTDLRLAQVDSVAGMMHARVLGWNQLSQAERMRSMEQLGREGAAKGFEVLYVVDEAGNPAATWTKENGVELK